MAAERDEDRPGPRGATIVDVLTPVAVDTAWSYRVPPGLALEPGDFVDAPLGTRATTGVVWATRQIEGAGPNNLKLVTAKRDLPPLRAELRRFVDWVAAWTLAPRGLVLRMATRAPEGAGPEPVRVGVRLAGPPPERLTPARTRVLAAAEGGLAHPKSALAALAGCGVGVVDGLVDEGALETVALPPDPVAAPLDPDHAGPALQPAQAEAAARLVAAVAERGFSVTLLEGVTGSGKTEVYFEAVAQALRQGRQALVMLPEIALTAQFLDRFAARFGARPAEWHSGVSPRKRARIWQGVADGSVRVVAGARSALFLPFRELGLIVVDEEHEGAYKQEDGVAYHARDMAVVRARLENATCALASATPSIETRVNALAGRYRHVRLPERFGGRTLPDLSAIDLKREAAPRGRWLAPRLVEAVGATIAAGEQALLFLNRRGYAPLTLCKACGHRFQCPNCTAWLVEHRFRRALVCHHCGHVERRPDSCPVCDAADALAACGPGVERLAEEVATLFPEARSIVLSSDFPGGAERFRRELEEIARGAFDIVVGTQLVAKGHNFPKLTLTGVIDADVGLANGDPRAAERTFQLLQQVTGRAGRGERPGRGLIQTWQPDHPVIRALLSGDAERFYVEETAARERAGLPPFGRLAALIVSGGDRAGAETHARALARAAHRLPASPRWRVAQAGAMPTADDVVVLGPAEAPIAVVRGRHRFRLLARAPKSADLQGFLRALLAEAPKPTGGVRVDVDVEPTSFL
ncbi:MAG: primosomal protein N' [Methylobacteriaceae bacterium]|nr:primosomal protein N' [Methylobacteriaceae bacterium]